MSFSATGMPAIEARVADDLDRITRSILSVTGNRTLAVILTGGYGRGEGGVCLRNGEMMPVNDYDLVVVVCDSLLHPFSRLRPGVRQLSRRLAEEIGVGVDLALVRESALPSVEPTIFWYETRWGHQVLWGDPGILEAMPPFDPAEIPLAEGARLLLNRGAMLLDALGRVNRNGHLGEDDIARVLTAGWKAALSWGDCILLTQGKYHYSYRARELAFVGLPINNGIPGSQVLKSLYRDAIRFKLFPEDTKFHNGGLAAWVNSIVRMHEGVFRWFEEVRLGRPFPDWAEYASARVPKFLFPLTPAQCAKNLIRNVRSYGWPKGISLGRWIIADPQERLISTLPLLLFTPNPENLEWCTRPLGARCSAERGADWDVLVRRFLELWH